MSEENKIKYLVTSLINECNKLIDRKANEMMIKYNLNDKKIINNIKNKTNDMIKSSKEDMNKIKNFADDELKIIKKYLK